VLVDPGRDEHLLFGRGLERTRRQPVVVRPPRSDRDAEPTLEMPVGRVPVGVPVDTREAAARLLTAADA